MPVHIWNMSGIYFRRNREQEHGRLSVAEEIWQVAGCQRHIAKKAKLMCSHQINLYVGSARCVFQNYLLKCNLESGAVGEFHFLLPA